MAFDSKTRPIMDTSPASPPPEFASPAPLSEIVAESAQRLAEAPQVPVQKRGRGRPRKDAQSHVAGAASSSGSPSQGTTPQSASAPGTLVPSFAPVFAQGIKIPFGIKANTTGWDGWNLSEPEAQALGEQIDQVVKFYMPQMDPKHAALASLGVSLMMITGSRMMGETDFKKRLKAQVPAKGPQPTANGAYPPRQPTPAPASSGEPVSGISVAEALAGLH